MGGQPTRFGAKLLETSYELTMFEIGALKDVDKLCGTEGMQDIHYIFISL